jgi:hypothetical protein
LWKHVDVDVAPRLAIANSPAATDRIDLDNAFHEKIVPEG